MSHIFYFLHYFIFSLAYMTPRLSYSRAATTVYDIYAFTYTAALIDASHPPARHLLTFIRRQRRFDV